MDTEWVTTTVLLERLHDFQDSVWEQFTERFHGPIVQFARRSGLPQGEAEDAAQETLLAFARSFREGHYDRSKGGLRSWLFGIAHHKLMDAMRRTAREAEHKESVGGRPSFFERALGEDQARKTWDEAWAAATLEQCLRRIRREFEESTWRAFELVALQGKPAATVADELGVSRNAVFLAKHRILKRLRELQDGLEA